MSVSYDVFTSAFLSKVTDRSFAEMYDYDRTSTVDAYMKRAITEFKSICEYDLSGTADDDQRLFNVDIKDEDIDEVTDIVSDGMLVQWMKPYVYNQENLQNILNTKDYSMFSPSEILNRVKDTYNDAKKDFTRKMREYSYNHGDISSLYL